MPSSPFSAHCGGVGLMPESYTQIEELAIELFRQRRIPSGGSVADLMQAWRSEPDAERFRDESRQILHNIAPAIAASVAAGAAAPAIRAQERERVRAALEQLRSERINMRQKGVADALSVLAALNKEDSDG
jgi:hypothetical protein